MKFKEKVCRCKVNLRTSKSCKHKVGFLVRIQLRNCFTSAISGEYQTFLQGQLLPKTQEQFDDDGMAVTVQKRYESGSKIMALTF